MTDDEQATFMQALHAWRRAQRRRIRAAQAESDTWKALQQVAHLLFDTDAAKILVETEGRK